MTARTSTHLVVIEAPGKRAAIERALQPVLPGCRVMATHGTLLRLPDDRMGINPQTLLADSYVPVNPRRIEQLKYAAAQADTLWVLTDNDREGEVIAAQIASITGHPNLRRVRAHALDPAHLQEAFRNPDTINHATVAAGIARRLVDRVIGFACSDRDRRSGSGIVGRISTRLLESIRQTPLVTRRFAGQTPDGLRIEGEIRPGEEEAAEALAALVTEHAQHLRTLAGPPESCSLAPPRPPNAADALLLLQEDSGLPLAQIEARLQQLYQEGRLSYPRTDSHRIAQSTLQASLAWADELGGIRPDHARMDELMWPDDNAQDAHEALHPIGPVMPGGHIDAMPEDDRIRALLARRCAIALARPARVERRVIPHDAVRKLIRSQRPDLSIPTRWHVVHDRIQGGRWTRHLPDLNGSLRIEKRPLDGALLERMHTIGIGRPSTYIRHIDTLIRRNMVLESGRISRIGAAALDHARLHAPFLLGHAHDPLEALLDDHPHGAQVRALIEDAYRQFGLERPQVQALIQGQAPKDTDTFRGDTEYDETHEAELACPAL